MKLRGAKVSNPYRVVAVGLFRQGQIDFWKRFAQYEANRTCPKCKRDKGSETQPCPYCHTSKIRSGKVKVTKLFKERVGARYSSDSRPNLVHTVYTDSAGKFVRCTCEGYKYRRYCKHMTKYLERKK